MSAFPNDTELREILNDAHIPALLGTLAHATRDLKLLREEFRPNYIETAAGFQPQGGLSVSALLTPTENWPLIEGSADSKLTRVFNHLLNY